ncbi:MFS transporter [Actinoplanes sp. NPDC026670]|uniref:MFS transporter n=1 Tax=Actinoplanes sp. NPDC026670 TaxID=3154700 RepID=UPI0033C59B4E
MRSLDYPVGRGDPVTPLGDAALLHELTRTDSAGPVVRTYICVPFGGGDAGVYQPVADALPAGHRLLSVVVPDPDPGIDELAGRCAAEILDRVDGPLVLYGHSGVGSALALELARRLTAAGRAPEAVYVGAAFPSARPESRLISGVSTWLRRLRSDQAYANRLAALGLDLSELAPGEAARVVRSLRNDADRAEEHYTRLLAHAAERLPVPIITIVGSADPVTEYFAERFREWHLLTDTSALVVLDGAGHYFLKYRAKDVARILSTVDEALPADTTPDVPGDEWRLAAVSRSRERGHRAGPRPSMRRFATVAASQLVALTGAQIADFAVPLWIYSMTGSLTRFGLLTLLAIAPGVLVAPLAGAVIDRFDRRTVMLAGDAAAGLVIAAMAVCYATGGLLDWPIYPLLALLSVALTFQRLAYLSAVPQLVPKQFLGHANGLVQTADGTARLIAPLAGAALLAALGIEWILLLELATVVVSIIVVLAVRFPRTMAHQRREPLLAEIAAGLRYSVGNRSFRAMLGLFAIVNVFMSPLILLVQPLALSFLPLATAGWISFAGGLGAATGGLMLTVWGGPRRRRMRAVLLFILLFSVFAVLTGWRASPYPVAVGVFGILFSLSVTNGIYMTMIQVKVPQRFHGRVLAANQMIAWSSMPVAFLLVAPGATHVLNPLLEPGGPLASTVGALIGVGPGRGIGLTYILCGLAIAAVAARALRHRLLSRFDEEVPDAVSGS